MQKQTNQDFNKYKKHYLHAELLSLAGIFIGFATHSLAEALLYSSFFSLIGSILLMFSSSFYLSFFMFIALMIKPLFALHKIVQTEESNMILTLLDKACYKLSYFNLGLIFKACAVLGLYLAGFVNNYININAFLCLAVALLLILKSLLFLAKNKARPLK